MLRTETETTGRGPTAGFISSRDLVDNTLSLVVS